jgi:predicted pore-forming effector associated with SMODS systems
MKNIRREIAVWVQFIVFLHIWASILYVSRVELKINWEAFKKIPETIAVYSVLHLIFTSYAWRFPILQGWLVPYPDLEGTWEGFLESTWVDPRTGLRIAAVPVVLVIKQSFSSINCTMHSRESSSFSNTAQISPEDESDVLRLSYNYTNRPKAGVRDRSEIHDGAAILRIVTTPQRALEGEYWTGRKTTGDLRLTFRSKDLADRFS